MKLIKCLNKHHLTDYVGVILNDVTPHFYTIDYLLQNKTNLLKCKVHIISSTITEVDDKQVPVVLYYLGI